MDDLYPPQTIAAGLAALTRRWPNVQSDSQDDPVFVLAAGWRSGSTLIQRALLSNCLVWGEPYGHAGLLEQLANPLRAATDRWPEPHFVYRGQPIDSLHEKFVANLYPPPQHLLDAYLAWFDALFRRPALAAGKQRWGLKEVRLSADHAAFLRWLYPQAKFIFLIRNPYDAFRSYVARREKGWRWYHRWPTHPLTPELFGRHWRELAGSFHAAGDALGGLVVHYEDLHSGGWQQIQDYVGFELSAAAIRTNPPDGGPRPVASLAFADLEPLRAEVEPLAGELGYSEGSAFREKRSARPEVAGQKSDMTRQTPDATRQQTSQRGTRVVAGDVNSRSPGNPEKCYVLVPFAERIEPACESALRELERRGYRVWRVPGYRQIDLGRCQIASDALAAGCEETLWIDADTGFHPDAVDRLRSHPEPIVSGIYPKKGKRELAIHAFPGTQEIVFGAEGGLIEILYAPTGFLLVRRCVYDAIRTQLHLPECLAPDAARHQPDDAAGPAGGRGSRRAEGGRRGVEPMEGEAPTSGEAPRPPAVRPRDRPQRGLAEPSGDRTLVPYYAPLIRPDGDGWWYLADDFAFCERARQCGYRIFADTTIRLWHIGQYAYGWEDAGRPPRRYSSYRFHLTDTVR